MHGKRICMVTYVSDPSSLPPLLNKARSLARSGYDVRVLCLTERPELPRLERYAGDFDVVRIYSKTRRLFSRMYGLSPRSTLTAFVQYFATYAEYNVRAIAAALRSKADLFEAHDLPTLPATLSAAALKGRPVLYHAHELHAETHRKVRFAGFWRHLERTLVPLVDTVITPEANRSRIMREEAGARRPPVTIMNCPPYRPPMRTSVIPEELRRRGIEARFVLLYQGLFDEERCVKELLAATRYFANGTVLVLIGSGYGEYADLRPLIPDPQRAVVLPPVHYDELHHYTASADAGVLLYRNTCRNNYYCAPNKVHEYMMMGLPVITNDYPGMRELVSGERVGLTVDCEDPRDIAEAVRRLVDEPDTYRAFRENALRCSRDRYNWERESHRLDAVYERLLGGAGPVGA